MPKNAFAKGVQDAYNRGLREGFNTGREFQANADAVGLNDLWGFGDRRLSQLEKYGREVSEMVKEDGLDVVWARLKRRVEMIRGKNFFDEGADKK